MTPAEVLALHTNKRWAGTVINACDECGETWPCHAVEMAAQVQEAERLASLEISSMRYERDLAIAHDRQPYPTAWAYEQACKDRDLNAADAKRWRDAEAGGHIVNFTKDGYGLQHPPSCRPNLIECEFNEYLARFRGTIAILPGRYRMGRSGGRWWYEYDGGRSPKQLPAPTGTPAMTCPEVLERVMDERDDAQERVAALENDAVGYV